MTMRKFLYLDTSDDGGAVEFNTTTDEATLSRLTLTGIDGIGIQAGNNLVSGVATPMASTDAATKGYVDAKINGIDWIPPAYAMSSSSISTLSGAPATVDGVSVASGKTVLLTAQTNAVQNGPWIVQSGQWVRPPYFSSGTSAASYAVMIEAGNTYANQGYTCTNAPGSDVVDTNGLTWVQFTGLGEVQVGNGLTKSGNLIAAVLATNSGLQFTGGAFDHLLVAGGGLSKNSSGLQILINTSPATLQSDSNGLAVVGVPGLFKVNGTAVSANVTAAALNTLTAGTPSIADSLHTHNFSYGSMIVQSTLQNGATALNAGDPVYWASANTVGRSDAASVASARVIGIAATGTGSNSPGTIIKEGPATNVLSGATVNTPYFLNAGGGLTTSVPTGSGYPVVRVGFAMNATDLEVKIQYMGLRS